MAIPLVAVGAFVLLHSGAGGRRICEGNGFSGPGSISWWPPGTTCRGGEPTFESVIFNPTLILVVVSTTLLLAPLGPCSGSTPG